MFEMLGTILLGMAKWFIEKKMKKKMKDEEFLKYIETYQKKRRGSGKTVEDFEEALNEKLKEMEEPKEEKK